MTVYGAWNCATHPGRKLQAMDFAVMSRFDTTSTQHVTVNTLEEALAALRGWKWVNDVDVDGMEVLGGH